MLAGEPSRTALAAARHRAAHQTLEHGVIFTDPLAAHILHADPAEIEADAAAHPERRAMRIFIAARHRVAEDAVGAAVAGGLRQVVVLGAGLDTQAYRSQHGPAVTFFEVDHPATQAWKQSRLAEAGIAHPAWLRFAAIDFESQSLPECLAAAGFDPAAPSIFVWLGVVPT
jgi:methyltransferase (TIGR00027 family)